MTWPEVVMLAVVIAGLAVSAWNVTAAALVAEWAVAQGVWLTTGDNLPISVYVICDIAVLGVIFCKPPPWNISDRIVAAIFPAMWFFYVVPIGDTPRWYILWALAIIQLISVTAETIFRLAQYYLEHRGLGFSVPPPWLFMGGRKMGVG